MLRRLIYLHIAGPNKAVANAADDTLGFGPVEVVAFATGGLTDKINGMFNLVFGKQIHLCLEFELTSSATQPMVVL